MDTTTSNQPTHPRSLSAPDRPPMLFQIGQVVATPGAIEATSHSYRLACLFRHMSGDFGCVCAEDAVANRRSIPNGARILSSYPIDPGKPCKGFGANTLWIITEADRSVTTFLLPSEY